MKETKTSMRERVNPTRKMLNKKDWLEVSYSLLIRINPKTYTN
jgi:hypothetical protein